MQQGTTERRQETTTETTTEELRPRVGVGVMVVRDGKVLMGKRITSHGSGEWAFWGGHLEHLETLEECARREVREEIGIEITNLKFLCVSNTRQYAPKHYVDVGYVAEIARGEPQNLEPHKREQLEWFDVNNPPSPMFGLCYNYLEALRTGRTYFDA